MKLFYMPLEPYEERYTLQLKDWTEAAFKKKSYLFDLRTIEPEWKEGKDIRNAGPLDYWRRSRWALLQTEKLISILQNETLCEKDAIYFQDMFHPGIEALYYIYAQKPKNERPRIFVQNCAQSMDVYDFTFKMRPWMRKYEQMVDACANTIFVASTIHKELMLAADFKAPIEVTNLPFSMHEVWKRLTEHDKSFRKISVQELQRKKQNRVLFTSRFDKEKQPHKFLDIVEAAQTDYRLQGTEFYLLQGGNFNSNDQSAVDRARDLEAKGKLTIKTNLKKAEYYHLLATSKVHINTALQDFVSGTLNEASAFGTKTVAPYFRSFNEALGHSPYCYAPFDPKSAVDAITKALADDIQAFDFYAAEDAEHTLERVALHIYSSVHETAIQNAEDWDYER